MKSLKHPYDLQEGECEQRVIPSPKRLQETQLGALRVPSRGFIYCVKDRALQVQGTLQVDKGMAQ